MITIYGAGDLIKVSGCDGAAEYTPYRLADGLMWSAELRSPDDGHLRVYAIYDGCWAFGIGLVEEDVPLPSWPVTIRQPVPASVEPPSTVVLEIDAPPETKLVGV